MVNIGRIPIALLTDDFSFVQLLQERYSGFLDPSDASQYQINIEVVGQHPGFRRTQELKVEMVAGKWSLRRGDFSAEWDPRTGKGQIQQSVNPYSVDAVLRIVHTLILAGQGGFLVHAASAIRNHSAFLFAGVSGAGKTTIARLAPPDTTLLTDEISYIRPDGAGYRAFGTPFAGELAQSGDNVSAPLSTLFLLQKGPANRIETVPPDQAIGLLLRNILFFAEDRELVNRVFQSACDFVEKVRVCRLTFVPDRQVWQQIG